MKIMKLYYGDACLILFAIPATKCIRIRRHAHLLAPVHDVRRHNQLHHTSKALPRFPWYSSFINFQLPFRMLTHVSNLCPCCVPKPGFNAVSGDCKSFKKHGIISQIVSSITSLSGLIRSGIPWYTMSTSRKILDVPPTSTSLASLLH